MLLAVFMAASSAAHAAWPRLNRTRLRHLAADGVADALPLLRFIEDPASPHSTLTVANSACLAVAASTNLSEEQGAAQFRAALAAIREAERRLGISA